MIKKILNQQKGTLKVIFKKPISDQISKLDRLTHFNGRLLDQYNSLIGFADLEKLHEKIGRKALKFNVIYTIYLILLSGHIQDQLLITQNKRQSILIELLSTRKELNSLQSEIQNSKRGTDNKYLQLVQQEYDILNKESELNDHFNLGQL